MLECVLAALGLDRAVTTDGLGDHYRVVSLALRTPGPFGARKIEDLFSVPA